MTPDYCALCGDAIDPDDADTWECKCGRLYCWQCCRDRPDEVSNGEDLCRVCEGNAEKGGRGRVMKTTKEPAPDA